MAVYLPAHRAPIHANRRRCTWMYETTNETMPGRNWPFFALLVPGEHRGGIPGARPGQPRLLVHGINVHFANGQMPANHAASSRPPDCSVQRRHHAQ